MSMFCAYYRKFKVIYHYWKNGKIPQKLLHRFNKKPVYGLCHSCGRKLSYEEMHPPKKSSMSMCQSCFNREAANNPNRQACMICDEWLPIHSTPPGFS